MCFLLHLNFSVPYVRFCLSVTKKINRNILDSCFPRVW